MTRQIKDVDAQVKLVSFLANNDPSAEQYAEVTKKKMALADDGGGGTAKEGKNAYKL